MLLNYTNYASCCGR